MNRVMAALLTIGALLIIVPFAGAHRHCTVGHVPDWNDGRRVLFQSAGCDVSRALIRGRVRGDVRLDEARIDGRVIVPSGTKVEYR